MAILGTVRKKPIGTSIATKAALLPNMEGQLGLGLPRVKPPSFVPNFTLPAATQSTVTPAYTPAPSTTPPASTLGTTPPPSGMSNEDFMNLIMGDPLYGTGQQNLTTALNTGYGQYVQTPFRQALQAFGPLDLKQVPEGLLGDVNKALDPTTLANAAKNPISTMAVLNQEAARSRAGIPYDLGARGTADSGAAVILNRKLGEAYDITSAQDTANLLQQLTQAQRDYLNYSNDQYSTFEALKAQIAARLAQTPGPSSTSADTSRGPYEGQTSPVYSDQTPSPEEIPGYPYAYDPTRGGTANELGDTSPSPFVPVMIGDSVSYEPKPTAGNYIPPASTTTPVQKALNKARAKATGPYGVKLGLLG